MKKLLTIVALLLCTASAFCAPVITSVLVTATTSNTATIQWLTSTPSSSALKYGTNASLPYETTTNPALVTSHTVVLTLLSPGPFYYVAAISTDGSGTTQSAAITFTLCGNPIIPVQGTATNYYQYGSYTLTWVPPVGYSQSPTVCGKPVTTTVTGKLDGGASFNTQVADASKVVPGPGQWQVVVNDAGNIAPITVYAYLSQVTQNVSAQLQTAAASSGIQACLTNTNTDVVYPASCGGSGSPGVSSINAVPGAFTFGAGASCSGTTCTFPGTGVSLLNGLTGSVTLAAGTNMTFGTVGNTITLNASGSGGGNPGGSPGAIQYQLNSTTFGGATINGIVKSSGSGAPTAATGSTNGTGDYQLPVNFSCTSPLNCSLSSSTWTFTFSGGSGTGTVTSAALSLPSWLAVSGSPVTTAGTFIVTPATGQTSHQVIGTCGSTTTFIPCALVAGDIPSLAYVSSVGLTVPSWLTVTGSPVTSSGTFAIAPTSGQISHQVIGTCGSATTFGPCALVAGDIPTLPYISNVFTTLGDTVYSGISGVATRLAGSTSASPALIVQTGTGSASAAPVWVVATGTGAPVLATGPSLIGPNIGAATGTSLSLTNGTQSGISGLGTAVYALGATAQVGTGATTPICVTNVVCDSLSGTLSFTTGSGTLSAGTIVTITLPGTRTNIPTCQVQVTGGTTFLGGDAVAAISTGQVSLPVTTEVALTASTAYRVLYGSCGGV